ncbi:hypothetical protein BH18ACI5_BH18ACI5_27920 [soil metagenome]
MRAHAIATARVASVLVALAGLTVLAGWFLGVPGLTSLYVHGPNVKTNAAIALVFGALANFMSGSPA